MKVTPEEALELLKAEGFEDIELIKADESDSDDVDEETEEDEEEGKEKKGDDKDSDEDDDKEGKETSEKADRQGEGDDDLLKGLELEDEPFAGNDDEAIDAAPLLKAISTSLSKLHRNVAVVSAKVVTLEKSNKVVGDLKKSMDTILGQPQHPKSVMHKADGGPIMDRQFGVGERRGPTGGQPFSKGQAAEALSSAIQAGKIDGIEANSGRASDTVSTFIASGYDPSVLPAQAQAYLADLAGQSR